MGAPQPQQAGPTQPTENPLMGLFLDRPAHTIDPKGFSACNNVRIELGRVRSDLMGWTNNGGVNLGAITLPNATNTGNSPCVYLDTFISSSGSEHVFAVTPTDILMVYSELTGYSPTWMTPYYNNGTVSVTNGSTTVTGSVGAGNTFGTGTTWSTDIQFGQQCTLAANVAVGANKIYLLQGSPTHAPAFFPNGMPVTCQNPAAAIPLGTYVANQGIDGGGYFIITSQNVQVAMIAGDNVQIGALSVLRTNVRAGDQIQIGQGGPQSIGLNSGTYYTVASVTSNNTLILTTPYTGATASGQLYWVKQAMTNTFANTPPTIQPFSSDTYLSLNGFNGEAPGVQNAIAVGNCDCWFLTNGIDPVVQIFLGGATADPNPMYSRSIPFFANAVKQFRGLMVLGGLNVPSLGAFQLNSIASSDDGLPSQFNSGVAFQGLCTDGPFSITRLSVLGAVLMIYGTGEWAGSPQTGDNMSGVVTSGSFVGGTIIWSFSDVVQTRGPVAGGAVAVFSDRHQFLAVDGEYRYNGLFIQVMNDQVFRQVMKGFDTLRPNACFATIIPTTGDLIWTIPQTTDPSGHLYASTAIVEHYMEQANSYLFKPITQRDFPFLCTGAYQPQTVAHGQLPGNQPIYFAGDQTGKIWYLYQSNTQNGTPALATATWATRLLGDGRIRPLVTRIYPEIEYIAGGGSVSITLTLQDAAAGPVTITDTKTFNPNYAGNIYFTTPYRRGRYGSVTMSDTAGLGWVAEGYLLDVAQGGGRRP